MDLHFFFTSYILYIYIYLFFGRNTPKIDTLAGTEGVLLTTLMMDECLQEVQWAPSLGPDVRKGMSWGVASYFPEIMFVTMTGKHQMHQYVTSFNILSTGD